MADAATHTEAWSNTLETSRVVGQLSKLRSRARHCGTQRLVSVSRTSGLTSRMTRKGAPCHTLRELPPEVARVEGR